MTSAYSSLVASEPNPEYTWEMFTNELEFE